MARTLRRFEIAILGGGILGLAVAWWASKLGYATVLIRRPDRNRPSADTLRNQSWLQSGFVFASKDFPQPDRRPQVARSTYYAGHAMLDALDLPIGEQGLVRITDQKDFLDLQRKVRLLGYLTSHVNEISDGDARSRLGQFYEEGSRYFTVPDTSFDEASVMEALRRGAVEGGCAFIETDQGVVLERDPDAAGGLRLRIGEAELSPTVLLVAAGAGSIGLCESLKVPLPVTLRQTPLAVLHDLHRMTAPLLIDMKRGYTVVRQSPEVAAPTGALIVGTRENHPVEYESPETRRISPESEAKFWTHVPDWLRSHIPRRFTAGVELIPDPASGLSYVEPMIQSDYSDYPGLVVAVPGRATVAWSTAQSVLAIILRKMKETGRKTFEIATSDWLDDIWMHFHSGYTFDDSRN